MGLESDTDNEVDITEEDTVAAIDMQPNNEDDGDDSSGEDDESSDASEESGGEEQDAGAQAEAVARLLGDALWADIAKAYEAVVPSTDALPSNSMKPLDQPILETIRTILSNIVGDVEVMRLLWSSLIPGSEGKNILTILTSALSTGKFPKELADTTAKLLEEATNNNLFQQITSPLGSPQFKVTGKRKREDEDEHEIRN